MRRATPAVVLLAVLVASTVTAQDIPWDPSAHAPDRTWSGVGSEVVSGADEWSDRFTGPPGVDGNAASAVEWRGDLYVGGAFRSAGGGRTHAGALAKWDGAAWHDVGGGLFDPLACPYSNCGSVYELLPTEGALIVGGDFGPTRAGPREFPFEGIAAWDGEAWQGLGPGLRWEHPNVGGGWVGTLVQTDEGLVAAGWFNRAGDAPVSNIARWDGEAWDDLGGGLPFWVESVATDGDRLVAVGFRDLEAHLGVSVAEWDGAVWRVRTLEAPSGSYDGQINAASFFEGDLVVGGLFDAIDGVPASSLARWDGSAWHPLGEGADSYVWDLVPTPDGDLVAFGLFRTAGGEPADHIAAWDGSTWRPLGDGVSARTGWSRGGVSGVRVTEDGLVVAGGFDTAGAVPAANVARWNGSAWEAIGAEAFGGLSGEAYAMAPVPGGFVVGGAFRYAGSTRANGIARWDGTRWHTFGGGLDGDVSALAVSEDGSRVAALGGLVLGEAAVAEWDGTDWTALESPTLRLGNVGAATYYRDHLYVTASAYDPATGTTDWTVFRWSGTDWEPPPSAQAGSLPPAFLRTRGDRLVLHGAFEEVGGVTTGPLAVWDGTAWAPLGDRLFGTVRDVAFSESGPVVVGRVGVAEGETPLQVLRWDGAAWQAVGGDLENPFYSGHVRAVAAIGAEAFVLGLFPENRVLLRVPLAGGEAPTPVAGAPDPFSGDLLAVGGSLVVAGGFARAGGGPSANIAVLAVDAPPTTVRDRAGARALAVAVAPNPVARGRTSAVALRLAAPAAVRVTVVDLLGREVAVLADGPLPEGEHRLALDASGLAPGLYVVTARAGAGVASARLVVGGRRGGR